jgi:hypothetical protein
MLTDMEARTVLERVSPSQSPAWYQVVGAIGRFEGNYGDAFDQANNWAASRLTTADKSPGGVCPVNTTPTTDHTAAGKPYTACISRFDTPDDGAGDLIHLLTRNKGIAAALPTGDATQIAAAMRRANFMQADVDKYAAAIFSGAKSIARNLKEPLAVVRGASTKSDGGGAAVAVVAAIFFGSLLLKRRRV